MKQSQYQAEKFYVDKLKQNPSMPRYNHLLAAIYSEQGQEEKADTHFRNSILTAPGNVMVRNDFALHLMRAGRGKDAEHELNKALLKVEDNATLLNSNATILARTGQFVPALEAATKARYINPNDPLNHRNLAKVYNAIGDSHMAYHHNLTSIQLENRGVHSSGGIGKTSIKDKANAYRAAAIQEIARGGTRDTALLLMSNARSLEGKVYECSTTERTNSIMFKIMQKKNAALTRQRAKEEADKAELETTMASGGKIDRGFTLPVIKKKDKDDDEEDSDEEADYDSDGNKVEKKSQRRRRTQKTNKKKTKKEKIVF